MKQKGKFEPFQAGGFSLPGSGGSKAPGVKVFLEADFNSAVHHYQNRRYEAALEGFLKLVDPEKENLEVVYYLGLCCVKLKRFDEAILYLEQVVAHHSNILLIYQSRMILSYIYCVTGRDRLAQFEIDRLLKQGFESPQVYATLGYLHFRGDRVEESLSCLQKALKLDPENPNVLNSLGYILADKNLDPEKAVYYCQAAVKKNPQNYAYLDSLGWAYFKAGRYVEARDYLRKALDLARSNKTVAAHMRDLLDTQRK
ncbi:MAG: tetratricopeptide repeat protein [Spirochaetales bacterium]|jgi:tetratricopeptide (TPR) repeat protein|nr:tetratricopeptide repeat protein [Spirochaetales bacterium]